MTLSKGFIYAFLAAFAWAVSIIIARFVLRSGENAYNIVFWTTLLAVPYWLLIFSKNRKEFISLKRRDYLLIAAIGLVSSALVNIVEALALKYSPATNYSFLIRSSMLFTVILAYFFLGEKITKKKIVLVILLLVGSYFLIAKGTIIHFTLGDVFTITEALLIAISNNVLTKKITNRMSVDLSSSASFLVGVLPISLIALFNQSISFPKLPVWVVLITVCYILITYFRFRAYKNVTASFVTMVFSFTPVIVSILAAPFLEETLTPIQMFGGALIVIAGVAVEKLKI